MSAHLGTWDFIKDMYGNATNSQQTAIHSFIFYNPTSEQWKVLYFSAYNREEVQTGVYKVTSRIWDPNSESGVPATQIIPDWPGQNPDAPYLFCSGHSFLPDGNLLVAGGHRNSPPDVFRGLRYTYIFDTSSETWVVAGSTIPFLMNDGRWYPTLTTLGVIGDGKIIAMSGYRSELVNGQSVVNDDPEIFNPTTGWSRMNDITLAKQPFEALYPGAHVIPYGNDAGKIFYSMPMKQAYKFNPLAAGTTGDPYWAIVGNPRTTPYRGEGCSIFLPLKPFENNDAKVLIIGGEENAVTYNSADIINFNVPDPQWQPAPSALFKRSHANATFLADGRVILIGGNETHFNEGGVTYAEVFDPEANSGAGSWTRLPAMTSLRMYHSSAVLMGDATVIVGGGDVPFGLPSSNTFQIYYPGYLFEGDRPEITSISTTEIEYNSSFVITTDIPIETAILIRFGAATHAFDQDQRAIFLDIKSGPSNGQIPYEIYTPNNANVAPKGYYMLFVLRPKTGSSSGELRIPSYAKFVHIT